MRKITMLRCIFAGVCRGCEVCKAESGDGW